ncbi:MAG: hypothetical protein JJT78_07210 [Leptospira sp.]|nr:hypothetical protein [Leptospira sp.]
MKYRMAILLIIMQFSLLLFCALPEVVLAPAEGGNELGEEASTAKPSTDLLRLTYDTAFRPPPGAVLEEKGSLHEKGNVYRLRFPISIYKFSYLKISSTNSENSSRFVYEVSEKEIEKAKWKKYYYLPVHGKPNSATISLFACGNNLSCARWEWYYNGFLIVFESKGEFSENDINQKSIAENYHEIIEKHLLVY